MGGEQVNGSLLLGLFAGQRQGLEKPTVKNTFLHYEGLDEAGPQLDRRIRTDPTPEVAGFGVSSRLEEVEEVPESLPSIEPPELDINREPTPEILGLGLDSWLVEMPNSLPSGAELDVNSDEDELPETKAQETKSFQAAEWLVPARKFRSKDTRLSKTFLLPDSQQSHDGDDRPVDTEYVVTLYPTQASKRRGGASFSASHGRGYIHVKCTAPSDKLERRISVQIGDSEPSMLSHNFAHDPVCRLPGEYNFEEHLNETSGNLSVLFEIAILAPAPIPAPGPCLNDAIHEAPTVTAMSMWPSWQSTPSPQGADGQVYQQACWFATPWGGWVSAASYGAPAAWVDPQNASDVWLEGRSE